MTLRKRFNRSMSEVRPDSYSFGDANQLDLRSGRGGDDSTDARSPMQIETINEVCHSPPTPAATTSPAKLIPTNPSLFPLTGIPWTAKTFRRLRWLGPISRYCFATGSIRRSQRSALPTTRLLCDASGNYEHWKQRHPNAIRLRQRRSYAGGRSRIRWVHHGPELWCGPAESIAQPPVQCSPQLRNVWLESFAKQS